MGKKGLCQYQRARRDGVGLHQFDTHAEEASTRRSFKKTLTLRMSTRRKNRLSRP